MTPNFSNNTRKREKRRFFEWNSNLNSYGKEALVVSIYIEEEKDICFRILQFVDGFDTYSFIPYINNHQSPTTKNLETLIDNVFYNKIIQDSVAGNVTTEIFDHLIQFHRTIITLKKN